MLERLHLALAPDELRQPAPRRALQPRAQRPEPGHLVNIDRLADAFDLGRPQRLEREIALDQLARLLADCDRAGRRERLHPRGEIGRMPDRRVFGLSAAGRDRAHHHFAGVHADARFDRQVAGLAQLAPNSASAPPASAARRRARAADGPRARPAHRTARRCRRRSIARRSRRSAAPRRSSASAPGRQSRAPLRGRGPASARSSP